MPIVTTYWVDFVGAVTAFLCTLTSVGNGDIIAASLTAIVVGLAIGAAYGTVNFLAGAGVVIALPDIIHLNIFTGSSAAVAVGLAIGPAYWIVLGNTDADRWWTAFAIEHRGVAFVSHGWERVHC